MSGEGGLKNEVKQKMHLTVDENHTGRGASYAQESGKNTVTLVLASRLRELNSDLRNRSHHCSLSSSTWLDFPEIGLMVVRLNDNVLLASPLPLCMVC